MTTANRLAWWALLLVFFILPIEEPFAADRAEPYVALYGGATLPQSFQDVRGTGTFSGIQLTDLDLKQSAIVGGKLGFFLPGRDRWSGIETEFFYTNPHIKQQNIGFTGSGVPPTTANFAGAHVRVATWAVNWILRYPGERFQPYVGFGPGIFWGRMSGQHLGQAPPDLGTGSDTSLGINALAGARFFFTKRLALFGEYKYNRASFDFGGTAAIHVLYQPQHIVGGLSFHF
ncbi:MAG: outer membrane protein [Nitrospiraceae bacterium]